DTSRFEPRYPFAAVAIAVVAGGLVQADRLIHVLGDAVGFLVHASSTITTVGHFIRTGFLMELDCLRGILCCAPAKIIRIAEFGAAGTVAGIAGFLAQLQDALPNLLNAIYRCLVWRTFALVNVRKRYALGKLSRVAAALEGGRFRILQSR